MVKQSGQVFRYVIKYTKAEGMQLKACSSLSSVENDNTRFYIMRF